MPTNPGDRYPVTPVTRVQAAVERYDRWVIAIAAFILGVLFGAK